MWRKRSVQQQKLESWQQFWPLFDRALVSDWTGAAELINNPDFCRETFLSFITEQDLAAALQWLLIRDGASAKLPSWLLLQLIGSTAYGRTRRREQSLALEEIADAAGQQDLNFLVLKGLHFAQRFYRNLDARRVRDLDLLVLPEDLPRFRSMLRKLSYEPQDLEWLPAGIRRRLSHASNWQRSYLELDLHHDLRVRPGYRIDTDGLFSQAQWQEIAGVRVRVPTDEDSLLLLIISIASDIEQGRLHGKSLLDLWVMLDQLDHQLDWDIFLAQRRREGLGKLTVEVLRIFTVSLPLAGQFSGVLKLIRENSESPAEHCIDDALGLFSAAQYSLANRFWFLRHYEGQKLAYLNWWIIGGVFRPGSVVALMRALSR